MRTSSPLAHALLIVAALGAVPASLAQAPSTPAGSAPSSPTPPSPATSSPSPSSPSPTPSSPSTLSPAPTSPTSSGTAPSSLAPSATAPTVPGTTAPLTTAPVTPAPLAPVEIDDAMLEPAAPAGRQLESWAALRSLVDERTTDLLIGKARVRQAQGRFRQSLSSLLPNASLSAGVGYDILNPDSPVPVAGSFGGALQLDDPRHTPTSPLGSAAVTLRQSVVDVSAWSAVDAAGASTRSAEAAYEDQRRRVLQSLAQSVVLVVTSERVAELSRVGLRQALERAAMTQRLFELGVATHLDVVRVRQDVAVARSSLIGGDEQLLRAREDLGAIVGLDVGVGVAPSFSIEQLVSTAHEQCEALPSIAERDDIKAARAQAEAAVAARREAWMGYLPALDVNSATAAYTTQESTGRFGTWTIAAVLSIPLWEGGFREGLVEERSALVTQADATLAQVERDAAIESARVQHAERAAKAVLASAREAYALAEELDRLTRRSFEMGRATSLEIVQSGGVLRQAQVEVAVRESQWLQSRLDAFFTVARCPS